MATGRISQIYFEVHKVALKHILGDFFVEQNEKYPRVPWESILFFQKSHKFSN